LFLVLIASFIVGCTDGMPQRDSNIKVAQSRMDNLFIRMDRLTAKNFMHEEFILSLKEIRLNQSDLETASDIAAKNPY
jgi:hypothetical protein